MRASILGVSIGLGCLGIAILSDGKLLKWKSELKWAKLIAIPRQLERHLQHHACTHIAIKVPTNQSSVPFARLMGQINVIAEYYKIPVYHYCLEDLKEHFAPGRKVNKRDLIEHVARQHSMLIPMLHKELKNSKPRYQKIFEAVATAEVCRASLTHSQNTASITRNTQNL